MLTLNGSKIAVEPLKEPDKIGSIHILEQSKSRANQGIVKYIGPDVSSSIEVGDHVLFGGYSGTTIHLEGEGHLIILQEEFIQAILHDDILTVPGLFFRIRNMENQGELEYYPASYEMAISLCKDAITQSELFQKRVVARKKTLDPQREFENAR